ncbi:hypothetical protein [Rhizobium leguminosarum]|uniref:hypothetical protein n=1 Tax=Rhizobium leguminosarum TaxID=384 RepID=UPI00103FE48D|nr:hypothetical protein [Rhizobium leguminosarum]TCA89199.1 hypothetical protein E0H76_31425 [Rhizobium leguminosarum bv. viciae]
MQSGLQQLARAGVEVSFLRRALSALDTERDGEPSNAAPPDWPDDHVPDVVEFVTDFLNSPSTGGANV